ncbi:MAG: hypothetical protein ACT4O5_13755 [Gammaproteobacteria bacterium]
MTDIKTVWKNQATEDTGMIMLSDIRKHAASYRSRIRLRNVVLYVYSIANIAASAWLLHSGRLAAYAAPMVLMIVAHLFVLWQVWRRAAARDLPGALAARGALDFHRHELQRQHAVASRAWLWYIAPFMPALIWEIGLRAQMETPDIPPEVDRWIVAMIIVGAVFFWSSVWLLFSRAAARLELQIRELNGLKAE